MSRGNSSMPIIRITRPSVCHSPPRPKSKCTRQSPVETRPVIFPYFSSKALCLYKALYFCSVALAPEEVGSFKGKPLSARQPGAVAGRYSTSFILLPDIPRYTAHLIKKIEFITLGHLTLIVLRSCQHEIREVYRGRYQ